MIKINVLATEKNGYEKLSNLLSGEIEFFIPFNINKNLKFKTVEHCYQVYKCLFHGNVELARKIYLSNTGFEAKKLSKGIKTNKEWEEIKNNLLYNMMKVNFKDNKEYRDLLLSTKDYEITHIHPKLNLGNWSKDFPQLLIKIRNEI